MTDKETLDQTLAEAASIALDVDAGMKTKYWGHLRRKIEGWLVAEEKHYEIINQKLLTEEDLQARNDCLKRKVLLKQFLNINEEIKNQNLTILEANTPYKPEMFNRPSFVNKK